MDLLTIFSKSFETLLLKLFQGKLPQKVIEPVENTDPPPGTSKKIISACKISSSGRCLIYS